ncbi:28S ribosomal protein S18c, mitochondrial [Thelohanellus kitauei]|uniref:28S ribosomal protein S18c, mitochondrial n=1 Tax=Thelohanellus kitauei TaxID=669202 RepID=A0A0C2N8E3_THEKT|nr:28S ribosomal protein S18c, mitochondrial [Thelohanellus kitauei]
MNKFFNISIIKKITWKQLHRTKIQIRDALKDLEGHEKPKRESECILCRLRIVVDYKFVKPETGFIKTRAESGLCPARYAEVYNAVKRARSFGFMSPHHIRPEYLDDPKL